MGSLNWASGLIPLGRLHLRPLQQHFHSLCLTNRFSPPRRSDPLVLATLLRQWQDLSFLTSGIPIRPFQEEFTIFTDALTQGWGAHMGIPKLRVYGPPSQRELHINVLELRAVILALHWVTVLQGHHVLIATDYTTAVVYINKKGWTHSHLLLRLVVDLSMYMFPPFFPAQQSHSEAHNHPDWRGDTHRPLVAITTVVSTPAMTECGSPTLLAILQRPVVTTGLYFERQVIPSA